MEKKDIRKLMILMERMIHETRAVNENILIMTAVLAAFNQGMGKTKTVRVADVRGSVTGIRR